uniref:Uncharacterized protein n=1 Tax=Proboscia inermis TaxID=420281 RepID=A0A7S0GEM2_9STRA
MVIPTYPPKNPNKYVYLPLPDFPPTPYPFGHIKHTQRASSGHYRKKKGCLVRVFPFVGDHFVVVSHRCLCSLCVGRVLFRFQRNTKLFRGWAQKQPFRQHPRAPLYPFFA